MDRPIKIQEKELIIINQNNDVSFIFNPDYYRKLLDNNCLFDVESVVYNIIRDEFLSKGKADLLDTGFKVDAKLLLEEDDLQLGNFLDFGLPLKGKIAVESSGLNASAQNFNIKITFTPEGQDFPRPINTQGIILETPTEKFLLNKAQEEAFRTYRNYLKLNNKRPNEHYNLVAIFKDLKSDVLDVEIGRFESLDISKIETVGLSVTQQESGDLKLDANLIGVKSKNESRLEAELNIAHHKNEDTTLYVGKELIRVSKDNLEGIKEIFSNRIIPKSEAKTFLENPASFIDADKINLESGFSFRVGGISKFTRILHSDIEKSENDWFLSNLPIIKENFEEYIKTEEDIEEFLEKANDAINHNSESILFDGKLFELPPVEEFKWRLEQKRKEIQALHKDDLSSTSLEAKQKPDQVSFDIKYFEENINLAELYQQHEALDCLLDGVKINPFDHQNIAINWIYSLYRTSIVSSEINGGILADDMGLGKTFSSLMGMKSIIDYNNSRNNENQKCFMVVAPLSLLGNWREEIDKFFDVSPFSDVVILTAQYDLNTFKTGKGDERKQLIDEDFLSSGSIKYNLKVGEDYNLDKLDKPGRLILITYETLRNYQFSMAKIPFSCVVFDEAQKIKNPNSLSTRAAKALNSDLNIIATGTPVENNLEEYWCLMDTANPKLFGSKKQFVKQYIQPLKKDESLKLEIGRELYHKSGPFLLRRTKEELRDKLGKRLPEKIEYKGLIDDYSSYMKTLDKLMTSDQISSYETVRNEIRKNSTLPDILINLNRMKACMIHPRLTFKNSLGHMTELSSNEFWQESAKLKTMLEILHLIKEKNEKVIIFLISRSVQYLLKSWINVEFGIDPDIVSGETKVQSTSEEETRLGMIKKFSNQDGFNIIILSPLAAGVGLNVTAANHVFHLERHWNPAKEAQANDRVYRIGQDKDVSIYYPISKHPEYESFDVKLDKLLSRKTFTKDALITYPRMSENDLALDIQKSYNEANG